MKDSLEGLPCVTIIRSSLSLIHISCRWELSAEDMKYLDEYSRDFAYSLPNYKTLFDKTIV